METRRKRRWIKVREQGPPQRRYIPLARYFWQRDHGPLPPGKFIVHRNGDTMDDRPANLMLMDFPHLLAFQRTIRPNIEAKRRAANAVAQKRRWAAYRRAKAFRANPAPNVDALASERADYDEAINIYAADIAAQQEPAA